MPDPNDTVLPDSVLPDTFLSDSVLPDTFLPDPHNRYMPMPDTVIQLSADGLKRRVWSAPNKFKTRPQIWHAYLSGITDGVALEFGVWNGRSINYMADVRPDATFFGFDSFEGLPEAWIANHPAGHFKTDETKLKVRPNVRLWKGWFKDSLPLYKKTKPAGRIQGVHIDCDLGSSTRTVLDELTVEIIEDKPLLLFDEFYNYEGYEAHEFQAFLDWSNRYGVKFEVVARNVRHQQVLIAIL